MQLAKSDFLLLHGLHSYKPWAVNVVFSEEMFCSLLLQHTTTTTTTTTTATLLLLLLLLLLITYGQILSTLIWRTKP